MPDEASPVSRCCFLASLRTTNTSKQYEPRVLLSKLLYHDFMNLRSHPVPEEAEERPGGVGPAPSAHLGGAQKQWVT